jgi:hypothetical protein
MEKVSGMIRSFKDSFENSNLLGGGSGGMLPNKGAGRMDNGVKLNTVNKSVLLTIAWSLASLCIMYVLIIRLWVHVYASPLLLYSNGPNQALPPPPNTHTREQVLRLRTLLAVQLHVQVHVPEGILHLY